MFQNIRPRRQKFILIRDLAMMLLFSGTCYAQQYQWSGAAASPDWSEAANWTNLASPPLGYTGRIVFASAGLGGINRLEANRLIGRSADTHGLFYSNNTPVSLVHTTDLNGLTLHLYGGNLGVGFNASNTTAVIQNGTLILGGVLPSDVMVGMNSVASNLPGINGLTVIGTLESSNLRNLYVGRATAGNANGTRGGFLDLRNAQLNSPKGANTLWITNELRVAANVGGPTTYWTEGYLWLPESLRSLEARSMAVGYERWATGYVDFGAASQLTNVVCEGNFHLCYGGWGRFLNIPTGVTLRVGRPGAPAQFIVAHILNSGAANNNFNGEFVLREGVFEGHLSDVYIGHHSAGNQPNSSGRVDLATCVIKAPELNTLKALRLSIGSRDINNEGAAKTVGYLLLPAALTNIDLGTFQFGAEYQGEAWLDIGENSQLRRLSVTNALYWGGGYGSRIGTMTSTGWVEYLPAGIEMQIGLSNKPALMHLAVTTVHATRSGNMIGTLRITNGSFRAYLTDFLVGINRQPTRCVTRGTLDLRGASLDAFEVSGNVRVGCGLTESSTNGYAEVLLPSGTLNIASNLFLGMTNTLSRGLLDLYGTTVRVQGTTIIERTGIVTARVYGVSAGLDILSTNSSDFIIGEGGRVHLVFSQPAPKVHALRMAGDQRSLFEFYKDNGRLTWQTDDGKTPEIVFDGTHTLVRYPAQAGAVMSIR